jgi:hypothetical protein
MAFRGAHATIPPDPSETERRNLSTAVEPMTGATINRGARHEPPTMRVAENKGRRTLLARVYRSIVWANHVTAKHEQQRPHLRQHTTSNAGQSSAVLSAVL